MNLQALQVRLVPPDEAERYQALMQAYHYLAHIYTTPPNLAKTKPRGVNFRPTALLTNQPRFEIFFYGIAESPKRIGAHKFSIE